MTVLRIQLAVSALFVGYAAVTIVRGLRQRRRVKYDTFGRMILTVTDELTPAGWIFNSFAVKRGSYTAWWSHPNDPRCTVTLDWDGKGAGKVTAPWLDNELAVAVRDSPPPVPAASNGHR